MVSIVVVAHKELAAGFATCVEHILNKKVDFLHVIAVDKAEDIDVLYPKIQQLIDTLILKGEVLLLVDLFGATPSNLAHKLVVPGHIELITGLNLPMLIRAVSYAKCGLPLCVAKALDGADEGISYVREVSR